MKKEQKIASRAAIKASITAGNESTPVAVGTRVILNSDDFYQDRLTNASKEYPHFNSSMSLSEFRETYDLLGKEEFSKKREDIMGRVVTIRMSGKCGFFDIEVGLNRLQMMANFMYYTGDDIVTDENKDITKFKTLFGSIHRGDNIGIHGIPHRTKSGELTIVTEKLIMLTQCHYILPGTKLENYDLRFRQRYLDLICDPQLIKNFTIRSQIIRYLRNYLDTRHFIEVETPVLASQAGGAIAKPFKTFHNELKQEMTLRISPELFLKQLVIGGMERVYEIGKQFRNEGMDLTHNPEFTSAEFYMMGKDYNFLMSFTEELLSGMVTQVNGSLNVEYDDKTIDFTPPFRRIDMTGELQTLIRDKLSDPTFVLPLEDTVNNLALIQDVCMRLDIKATPPFTMSRLIDTLVGELLEVQCMNPTFIINHPRVMSPLAKPISGTNLTQRFELFVNGKELANAYTELNSPYIQRENFTKVSGSLDDEVPPADMDFVKALEYGLPPTAGWGMGIDRLVMFLTNNTSIREVILFPTLKNID
jgi:lysyl-tRNA synthetase class 2